eukprot:UN2159
MFSLQARSLADWRHGKRSICCRRQPSARAAGAFAGTSNSRMGCAMMSHGVTAIARRC